MSDRLRVAGFFAGIGGLELGLAKAGHETTFLCEIDPACRAVLGQRWDVQFATDIRRIRWLPNVDLVAAGFPCQDLSQAGLCRGLRGSNSGLVHALLDLVEARRRKPEWILLENVRFLLHIGRGAAMRELLLRLQNLGYRWAYRVVDTRSFGVPQRRERVVILAAREGRPQDVLLADDAPEPTSPGIAKGFYWTEGTRGLGWAEDAIPTLKGGSSLGIPSPPAIWLPDGRIVTPDIRDAERLQGFRPGWTRPAERDRPPRDRWRLVGNAVSVPVAHWLGRRLARPGTAADGGVALDRKRLPKAAWGGANGAWISEVGPWPLQRPMPPIHEFLRYPLHPLSHRAATGFISRFERSRLRKPPGFLEALIDHRASMADAAA